MNPQTGDIKIIDDEEQPPPGYTVTFEVGEIVNVKGGWFEIGVVDSEDNCLLLKAIPEAPASRKERRRAAAEARREAKKR